MNSSAIKAALVCLMFFSLAGCGMFKGIGEDFGGGLAKGAVDSLDTPQRVEKLNSVIDSLIAVLGVAAKREVPSMLDTLQIRARVEEIAELLKHDIKQVRDDLVGTRTQGPLLALRDSLLGAKTNAAVQALVDSMLVVVLSTRTVERAGALRDELLGPKTKEAVSSIVDSAMMSLARRYELDLSPALQGDLDVIRKYAKELLITLGVVAIAIVGYFWWQKTKYRKTVAILAQQINEIPDQELYDNLTLSIRRNAQVSGVEPLLRKTLAQHGLLGVESWRPTRKEDSRHSAGGNGSTVPEPQGGAEHG
ncbi:MAG: hypothetical protein HW407_962 [Bacteroidetes bacterium]|nr:hypothetical protein [Bacteroidota bacterium]